MKKTPKTLVVYVVTENILDGVRYSVSFDDLNHEFDFPGRHQPLGTLNTFSIWLDKF